MAPTYGCASPSTEEPMTPSAVDARVSVEMRATTAMRSERMDTGGTSWGMRGSCGRVGGLLPPEEAVLDLAVEGGGGHEEHEDRHRRELAHAGHLLPQKWKSERASAAWR